MSNTRYQMKIVNASETPRVPRRALVRSWIEAAGSLRTYKRALEKHVQTVRREWRRGSHA